MVRHYETICVPMYRYYIQIVVWNECVLLNIEHWHVKNLKEKIWTKGNGRSKCKRLDCEIF